MEFKKEWGEALEVVVVLFGWVTDSDSVTAKNTGSMGSITGDCFRGVIGSRKAVVAED